jgi:hypothetical protein
MKKLYITNILLAFVFFFLVFIASCKDTSTAPNPDNATYPPTNLSYSNNIQGILNHYCTAKGCHNSTDHGGGIDLTSYLGTFSQVIPKYPNNSPLILVIKGLEPNHFNYNTVPLKQNEITAITTWVTEGAKNN